MSDPPRPRSVWSTPPARECSVPGIAFIHSFMRVFVYLFMYSFVARVVVICSRRRDEPFKSAAFKCSRKTLIFHQTGSLFFFYSANNRERGVKCSVVEVDIEL